MMNEDREILAAEYVIGTLDASERAQAEALIAADREFASAVRAWERRLGELHAMVEEVEPPAGIWDGIRAGIGGFARPAGGAEIVDLTRRMKRWRNATYVASALAASLLLFVAVKEFYPGVKPAEGGRFVAVLQRDAVSPGFLLTVDLRNKSYTVRKVGADKPSDRDYELWLVHEKFPGPRSLGLVGDGDFTQRAALQGYDPKVISESTYAVSLEPRGGSPTGAPTGPVVFTGKLIEAEP